MALLLAGASIAHAATLTLGSATVTTGAPYSIPLVLSGPDALGGLHASVTYGPGRNVLLGLTAGPSPVLQLRSQPPDGVPDSSGAAACILVSPAGSVAGSTLATLHFRATGTPGSQDTLRLQVLDAVDPLGSPISVTVEPGVVTFAQPTDAPGVALPRKLALAVHPTPSRGRVEIQLDLPHAARLRVDVFDLLGRRVAVLHDQVTEPGAKRWTWHRPAAGASVYFVSASVEGRRLKRRMIFLP